MNITGPRWKRSPDVQDEITNSPSRSNRSIDARVYANRDSEHHLAQPSKYQQSINLLAFTFKQCLLQTAHAAERSAKCTWLLLRSLPSPCFEAIRHLIPLWLAVFRMVMVVTIVLLFEVAKNALGRLQRLRACVVSQQQ